MPDKKCFNSSIKDGTTGHNDEKLDGHINHEDCLTCRKIWNTFNMKDIGDYHDHYLKIDVLLLADVFEKFIDTCLKFYNLDPCHYFSSPGLSWDVMLKVTGVKFKKIFDIGMYLFIEKELRRGISFNAKRYSKANNKYMKDYDPIIPPKYISYLDMNNFYGWAMSSYLPYGGFKWLQNVDLFDVNSIIECNSIENSSTGYILKVDLKYPDELHTSHNDYPLAPEKTCNSL